MKSNLFFHGHPINREEAEKDLKLKIIKPSDDLEKLMWDLYLEYEESLKLLEPFNLLHELEPKELENSQGPLTVTEIVQRMAEMAASGIGLAQVNEEQFVKLATAMVPFVRGTQTAKRKIKLVNLPVAYMESFNRTDVFRIDMAIERATMNTPAGPQDIVKQEMLWQRWEHES